MNKHRMEMVEFCRDVVSASLPDVSVKLSRVVERKLGELKTAEERAISQMSPYSGKKNTRENYDRALDCLEHIENGLSCIMDDDWEGLHSSLDTVVNL